MEARPQRARWLISSAPAASAIEDPEMVPASGSAPGDSWLKCGKPTQENQGPTPVNA